jgi:hypothetical protein
MRIAAAGALAGLLIASGCTSDKQEPSPVPPPGNAEVTLKITSAKAEFAAGEAVVLRVELTNHRAAACQAFQVPEGSVAVVSLTQDDNAVLPALGSGSYVNGMASYLRQNLVPVAPGGSLAFNMRSDSELAMEKRQVLETSTLDELDQTALLYWPVDAPGRYVLSARYVPPSLSDAPPDVCAASGDPAQVSFAVSGG